MKCVGIAVVLGTVLAVCAQATLPSTEQSALVAFFEATGGRAWRNHSGWLEAGTDPCVWYGVGCSGPAGGEQHVTTLFLSNNNLAGTVPEAVGRLTELTAIDLGQNQLTGVLPAGFAQLTKLYAISLKENGLSGALDFSRMGGLQYAHLDFNGFTGTLDHLCACQALKVLGLVNNAVEGAIPDCFLGFTQLQTLHLGGNRLSGAVPAFSAAALRSLDLSRNALAGVPAFGKLLQATGLTEVDYFGNRLSGPLDGLAGHPALVVLDVHDNKLTGRVPAAYAASMPHLYVLHAQRNSLTGHLPDAFAASTVASFDFTDNPLYCPLPQLPAGGTAACTYWQLGLANPSRCVVGQRCFVVVNGANFVAGERVFCRFGDALRVPALVVSPHELRCVAVPQHAGFVRLDLVVDDKPVTANQLPFEFVNATTVAAALQQPHSSRSNGSRRSNAEPVRVRIHGESKCPDFGSIATIFQPLLHRLGPDVLDVQLGWIMKEIPEYATGYWSLHGQAEVIGNAMISCVAKQHNVTAAVDFAACLAEKIDTVPNNAPACAARIGADFAAVRDCALSPTGSQLLRRAMELSDSDGAVWSPTVVINDDVFCLWHSSPCMATTDADFLRAICAAYTGPKPSACN